MAALLLVGCAGDDSAAEETTDTVTLPAFSNARVYWLRDGKVWPVLREVQASSDADDGGHGRARRPDRALRSKKSSSSQRRFPSEPRPRFWSRTELRPSSWTRSCRPRLVLRSSTPSRSFRPSSPSRSTATSYTRGGLRGADPVRPRRVAAWRSRRSRARFAPKARRTRSRRTFTYELTDTDGTHRRRELRHRHLWHGYPRDLRVHDKAATPCLSTAIELCSSSSRARPRTARG